MKTPAGFGCLASTTRHRNGKEQGAENQESAFLNTKSGVTPILSFEQHGVARAQWIGPEGFIRPRVREHAPRPWHLSQFLSSRLA